MRLVFCHRMEISCRLFLKVVDLAELADMLDEGVITEDVVKKCLRRLEKLLHIIYEGKFEELTKYLEIEGSK